METEIQVALITAGAVIFSGLLTLAITSFKEYQQNKLTIMSRLVETRAHEDALDLENATLGFISSVERFIRIKLYMISNGGTNKDNPSFVYYSELMNEVETHYSKLRFVLEKNEEGELLQKIDETKNKVINDLVIPDLGQRLQVILDLARTAKAHRVSSYYKHIGIDVKKIEKRF